MNDDNKLMNSYMLGFQVYVLKDQCIQFRFPRSRCRRIRKKWTARRSNFRTIAIVPHGKVLFNKRSRSIYCRPEQYQAIIQMGEGKK